MRSYATHIVAGCIACCCSTASAHIAQQDAPRQSTPRAPYTLASGFPTAKGPAAVVYDPPESGDGLVHIVMSADAVLAETRIDAGTPIEMEIVGRRDTRLVGSPAASRAVWVKHDPERREPQLQGTEFYGVAVGAFRRDQLCGGCFVVLYRLNRGEGHKRLIAAWAVIPAGKF